MLGRAGRPQYDTSAVAVIMTRQEKIKRYERMVSGEQILESWFGSYSCIKVTILTGSELA
jgi:replicative superfamily II helicase